MKKISCKKVIIPITIIIAAIAIVLTAMLSFSFQKEVSASVNGEKIYEYQIDNVLNQSSDHSLIREDVLKNSIDQLVVVQYGKANGIDIDNFSFEQYIEQYKEQYTAQYKKGISIYGKKEFYAGLKYHLIYQKTKDTIIGSKTEGTIVTEELLNIFLKENGINSTVTPENFEIIKTKYLEKESEIIFNQWVDELRKIADIQYFS